MFNILSWFAAAEDSQCPLSQGQTGVAAEHVVGATALSLPSLSLLPLSPWPPPQVGAGGGWGQEAESARPRGAAQGDPADPHPAVPQVQEQHRGELILGEPLLSALSWEPLILELHYLPSDPLLSSYHVITNSVISNLFQSFQTSLPPPQPTI